MIVSRPRLVFMGTPELARVVLSALAQESGWEIPLVVAQPDKPVGRGLQLQAPPVKREALERGIPVLQPGRARDPEFIANLAALAPDVVVVAAYGQILPPALLAIPRFGCLNVHTSILPRWRGAAPIAWAMLEGDAETGVTLMQMDVGLDTGAVIAEQRTPILSDDTGQSLHDRLAGLGASLICKVLPDWMAGRIQAVPQPADGVTYARKLTKEDGRLDWAQSASALDRKIRALNPWPGAFTTLPSGSGTAELLKIWEAKPAAGLGTEPAGAVGGEVLVAQGDELMVAAGAGGEGLQIRSLQREGRRRMTTREFLAGAGLKPGMRLGV
jgi:methionyl-tRNA formyltransferase